MKTRIASIVIVALLLGGCATLDKTVSDFQVVQSALNAIIPPGFVGDLEGAHDGYYFGTSVHLEFDLRGLHQVGDRWVWDAGGYKRKGFFSQGGIQLTPKTK